MSEPSNGAWPFQEIPEEEGLDISAIFGDSSAAPQGDPFAPPAAVWRGTGREPRGGSADKASPRGLWQLLS